ncbi:MAG: HI0074 family nucleotidyltransferase substrate-binding subunit [Methylococcaceae bacterium]|jgi:nucleotidyltransferase substrate binding protein (TIGR01987 family)
MGQDSRLRQRFANYQNALAQLTLFIDKGVLNELEEQGLIQAFEYIHELAWNVLRDYLLAKGQQASTVRNATRLASQLDLINDGRAWMEMIRDRIRTSHT